MNKKENNWEEEVADIIDPAHRNGSCSFRIIALCSATEHRVKMFIREIIKKEKEKWEAKLLNQSANQNNLDKRFDEKFGYKFNIGVVPDDFTKEDIKQFIQEEIKRALEEVADIDLALDVKTFETLGSNISNKEEAFGFGQAFVCTKLRKNIDNYLK